MPASTRIACSRVGSFPALRSCSARALVAVLATRFDGLFMASDDAYIYLGYVKSFVTRGELPQRNSLGTIAVYGVTPDLGGG